MIPACLVVSRMRSIAERNRKMVKTRQRWIMDKLLEDVERQALYMVGGDSHEVHDLLGDKDCFVHLVFTCVQRRPHTAMATMLVSFNGRLTEVDLEMASWATRGFRDTIVDNDRIDLDSLFIPPAASATIILVSRPDSKIEPLLWIHRDLSPQQAVAMLYQGFEARRDEYAITTAGHQPTVH